MLPSRARRQTHQLGPGAQLGDYEIRERLGAGGMGVVYAAHDLRRNRQVALKVLRRLDASHIYRLKREFRSLADVVHPNLVQLYELVARDGEWFYAMELVRGVGFLRYVQRGADREVDAFSAAGERTAPTLDRTPISTDEQHRRLRHGLRELAAGLASLHAAGKMHRDVKPSNVIVTRDERVVLVDFGFATEHALRPGDKQSDELVGTAAYVAPEVASGQPLTPASDWYAVGVMLYEALTGAPPFQGPLIDVLVRKSQEEPPAPQQLAPAAPNDLDRLCVALIRRAPGDRPEAAEILRALDAGSVARPVRRASIAGSDHCFVGRAALLDALRDGMDQTREGRAVAIYLRGPSGVGKTALVEHFLDALAMRDDVLTLRGRCHERESVPYKAVNGIIDDLARKLRSLPERAIEALLPSNATALARVFPTLARVEALARDRRDLPLQATEPLELRRRAFGALRELLVRLTGELTVVLSIDDLQWGDEESAALLLELLRPPTPPPLLLLGTYRTDLGEPGACLRALLAEDRAPGADAVIERQLEIPPLDHGEAAALAGSLLAGTDPPTSLIDALVLEARGNPFFLTELAYQLAASSERAAAGLTPPANSLEELVRGRVQSLPASARRLLELLTVAAGPVPRAVALAALGDDADDALTTRLRAEHLLRSAEGPRGEMLEIFHQRIGQIALGWMSGADRRARCAELAAAMSESASADPETLAALWLQAGDRPRARALAQLAAERASEALAFGRAARLHRWALELMPEDDAERERALAALADALANAGEPRAAADVLARLADRSAPDRADDYRRQAANQLVRGGHADEAYALLRDPLRELGVGLPATPRRAVLTLLGERVRLRVRGLRARVRDPARISAARLEAIDVCQSLAHGLGNVDPIRAAVFQARALRFALRAGDPHRLAVALATEAAFIESMTVRRGARRADRALARAEELATLVEDPYPRALTSLLSGIVFCLRGQWQRSLNRLETAQRAFSECCPHAWWEKVMSEMYACWALAAMGRFHMLSHRLPSAIRDADERGDQFASTGYRTGYLNLAWLAVDDVSGAAREAERAMAQWKNRGMHAQHWLDMIARTHIALYLGRPGEAIRGARARWDELRRAYLLRVKNVRVSALDVRSRAALSAAIAGEGDRDALLAEAERCARALLAEPMALAVALGSLAAAGVAHARGDVYAATVGLRRAVRRLDDTHMNMYAAGAMLELADLVGGVEGQAARRDAEARMEQEGIVEPRRFATVHAPGIAIGDRRALMA